MKQEYIEIEIDGTTYFTYGVNEEIEVEIKEDSCSDIIGVCPPIAGIIVEILKKEGDKVKKGEKIAILDAMKMHNFITSPAKGRILNIPAREGQRVKSNEAIIEIEEV
ncbi:MAG: biotin/lipoyl-binding protein [Paludibacteraceae bacterium]|nr:biotin/lipoyl-binding protein [Paludibacteraceae bacterium]